MPRTIAVLEHGVRLGWHPGAQLYVSHRGVVLADAALGAAKAGVPMTPQTVNVWFSSGKPLTTVAVARLCETGGLQLDDCVARHIPEFGVLGKDQIRIRHLLNHTAGFRGADRLPPDLPWDAAIAAICASPAEAGWRLGEQAGYQLFSSWFILGELVRRVDGRSLDRYVKEEIFDRLGMRDCWMGMPAERYCEYGDRLGVMHYVSQGALVPHPLWNTEASAAVLRPGGNVRGPVRELGRFYEGLIAGRLIRPATLATFTARSRVGMFDETFRHRLDWGLGFGLNSNRYGSDTAPYGFGPHASDAAFGHGGSQSSCGFADPDHGLVVAWLCNGMIGETAHQERARRINAAIYEDLAAWDTSNAQAPAP